MRLAVTGATGRVGSRLLPRLVARGHEVRALVRTSDAADRVAAAGATPVVGDLRGAGCARDLVGGTEAVVHVAAVLRTPDAELVQATNVDATAALADAAAAAGVRRLLFTSTNLVYPGGLGRPAGEDDPVGPAGEWGSAYPRSKVAAEQLLLSRSDLVTTVLRLAFVYGEGDPHLREVLRWTTRWPSYQRLHLVHHADVALAVLRSLEAPSPRSRVFNVADDTPLTAVEVHQMAGEPHPGNEDVDADLWHGIVATRRIRRELGFAPLYPSAWRAWDAGAL